MGFTLTSAPPPHIYPGLIISYRLRPLLGLPADWVTEITHVEDQHRFIDEQRMGPYRLWHHEHTFRPVPGGTEVSDLVYYALPFGPLGTVVQRAVVRQRLAHIFEYRASTLRAMFGEMATDGPDAMAASAPPNVTSPLAAPTAPGGLAL